MDLLKIIKDIKYIKTLGEFSIKPQDEVKLNIEHCLENVIDLDHIIHEADSNLSLHKSQIQRDIDAITHVDHLYDGLENYSEIDKYIIQQRIKSSL